MADVVMYCTASCPYCVMAERLLKARGVDDIHKVRVDLDPGQRASMMERTGRRTVPQIFIDGKPVGGSDELHALERSGELDKLLGRA